MTGGGLIFGYVVEQRSVTFTGHPRALGAVWKSSVAHLRRDSPVPRDGPLNEAERRDRKHIGLGTVSRLSDQRSSTSAPQCQCI